MLLSLPNPYETHEPMLAFPGTLTPNSIPAFVVLDAQGRVAASIVGELPSGIRAGLAGQLLGAMQYYSIQPGALWAAIVACALLGIASFVAVVLVERRVLRDYRPTEP